jgi:hypothetical protein
VDLIFHKKNVSNVKEMTQIFNKKWPKPPNLYKCLNLLLSITLMSGVTVVPFLRNNCKCWSVSDQPCGHFLDLKVESHTY